MAENTKGPVIIDGPPGVDSFRFRSMRTHDALGAPFRYELELLSDDGAIDSAKVVGQPMAVHLDIQDGDPRHYHGIASEFATAGAVGSHFLYRVTLRPWFWFLSKRHDCRIFQNKSIPDIVKEVFREANLADFEESLSESYSAKDYVVQYRESDLNFVSRLLEQEGIYFFFKHEASKHVLVLADSQTAHSPYPNYSEIPFQPPDGHRRAVTETVDRWDVYHDLESSGVAHTDYDFERPTASLMAKRKVAAEHTLGDLEVYDYPGKYVQTGDGDTYARVRLEEINAVAERREGETNARGVSVGSLFSLTNHAADAQNKEYLVVSSRAVVRGHDLETRSDGDDEEIFRANFVVIDSSRPYRPARVARKPIVQGVQTATVVGASGEEIFTDNYGRVKVKFPWDRAEGADEKSSCWIRVSQLWAGAGWGGIHIPRIGQEVIVDFLEGDPDRPIITGRVYNGDNATPYALPGNATQSGIKSRSSKGGGAANFNELRFEDKKGDEQIYMHAEKDNVRIVENDETIAVGHDRVKVVDNDETTEVKGHRTETVHKNETIEIKMNRTEKVGAAESITIGTTRGTTVMAADTLTVGGAHVVDVGAAQSIAVGGIRAVSVGAAESYSVKGSQTMDIGGNSSLQIKGGRSVDVGKDETFTIKGARTYNVGKNDILHVGKKLEIVVTDEIIIKSGSASISMKKNGDITIKGKNLTLEGSGKVNVKASSDVIVKGSKIGQN